MRPGGDGQRDHPHHTYPQIRKAPSGSGAANGQGRTAGKLVGSYKGGRERNPSLQPPLYEPEKSPTNAPDDLISSSLDNAESPRLDLG